MSNDFFLMERVAQIQRLRAEKAGNRIEIPGRVSRVGYSRSARQLFQSIDQICAIQLGEKRSRWLARVAQRGATLLGLRRSQQTADDESVLLTPQQRDVLTGFERHVVEVQLEAREQSADEASVFETIVRDQSNFNGLKPMQFHSDAVAYELMFPSWLNLYTALATPRTDSAHPTLSHKQLTIIFDFLRQFETTSDSDSSAELVGALTLVASRLPPAEAQVLIQQLMNLGCMTDQTASVTSGTMLERLQEENETAAGFLQLVRNLTLFETCVFADAAETKFELGVELPRYQACPKLISKHIRSLEHADGALSEWAEQVGQVARIVDGGGGIDPEYAEMLTQEPTEFLEWLKVLTPAENQKPLSLACQRLVARMVKRSPKDDRPTPTGSFARVMAGRLELLAGPMADYFEKEFIERNDNRKLLLRCVEDSARRRQISDQLVKHARKTSDRNRLLSQMTIAAIFDPDYDAEKLNGIERTAKVLNALEENGFISSNQLEELATDIRRRLPDSMQFLVAPYLGATDQEGRMAKLYLALYEECEKFEHYGETGNFGLTTAAYGNLNRTIDRET